MTNIWDGVMVDNEHEVPDFDLISQQQQAQQQQQQATQEPPPDDAAQQQQQAQAEAQTQTDPPPQQSFNPPPPPGQPTQAEIERQQYQNRVDAARNQLQEGKAIAKRSYMDQYNLDEETATALANRDAAVQWAGFERDLANEEKLYNERVRGDAAAYYADQFGVPMAELRNYDTPAQMEAAAKARAGYNQQIEAQNAKIAELESRLGQTEETQNRQAAPPQNLQGAGNAGNMTPAQEAQAYARGQIAKSDYVDQVLREEGLLFADMP